MASERFHLPSNDLMFKMLFAASDGAKERLKILICEILSLNPNDIEELVINNAELPPPDVKIRHLRFDILATIKLYGKAELLNVEMQRITKLDLYDRALYQWARIHQIGLLSGEAFTEVRKTISIWLLSENIDNSNRCHRIGMIKDLETNEIMSDKLEFHFIELAKYDFSNVLDTETGKLFLKVLASTSKEELDMIQNATANSAYIQDLIYRINAMNKDEKSRLILEQRQEELLYELREQQLLRDKAAAEKAKTIAEHAKTTAELLAKFVEEFYKTAISLPEHVKKETGKDCTPFDFFKVTVQDTVYCFNEVSKRLAGYISSLLELDVSIADIAQKVNANPDDIMAFHKKYA
ncbi:MAG: Rpn family recombination-promoting nuclease/putative transposase [Oscillospiraceae bacterium]|nr:Rpn family recombination-promoting nuclease/putative transposase [Oscillospiraceae bacterium]